jgi:high affinity Mn2+ porin
MDWVAWPDMPEGTGYRGEFNRRTGGIIWYACGPAEICAYRYHPMPKYRGPPFIARLLTILLSLATPVARAHGERDLPSEDKSAPPFEIERPPSEEWYSLHYQFTASTQYHPSFFAKHSGTNSLSSDAESATAFVTTLYADLRLWPGGELLFNPEMSGGVGLSQTRGVAAFPSGIVYRVGDPTPAVYLARLAISQTFGLGGGRVSNEAGPNELLGTRDRDVLAITIGRLSVIDVVDANRYANDATTEFFNWALFASGAYDYPADTRGYTWGVLADLAIDWWSVRGGIALEPLYANLQTMDWRVDKSHGLMAEYEARYTMGRLPGASSLLVFLNTARMGSYEQVLADPSRYGNDVAATRGSTAGAATDQRSKYGFALSVEQQLTPSLGAFLRLSWNDGHTESWAFTEIDHSLAIGAVQNGKPWRRPRDIVGAATVVSGLSPWHERYLAQGGYGFIIGDGSLNYGPEIVSDFYYRVQLSDSISLTAFYQPVINPAYNQDRGPVHIFTGRLHVSF